MRNIGRIFVLGVSVWSLISCAGDAGSARQVGCPQTAIVRALEKNEDYAQESALPENLVAVAEMKAIDGACVHEKKGVEVRFSLSMAARKGPRLGGETINFPFFVSVVAADDSVKAKTLMTASFAFEDGAVVSFHEQPLRVFIPLREGEEASGFRVLTGFQLTQAQLSASAQADGSAP